VIVFVMSLGFTSPGASRRAGAAMLVATCIAPKFGRLQNSAARRRWGCAAVVTLGLYLLADRVRQDREQWERI